MSSGLLECLKCHKYFDVTVWVDGKAQFEELPYKCPYCGAKMDFNGYKLNLVEDLK